MPSRTPERWIWTELIGFDNRLPDGGVAEYLAATGFVPDAVCLLLTSVDFMLSHQPTPNEVALPPDVCARDGHEHNRQRQRQVWTNHQLRALLGALRERGIATYLTVFTRWYGNRWHPEWLADHPETFQVWRRLGRANSVCAVANLADGTPFQEVFARQLVATLADYGFDGWHGADGWGPLNGPIYEVGFSDSMVSQFAAWLGEDLPPEVATPADEDRDRLLVRGDWLWRHRRRDWIAFWADRWTGFWSHLSTTLHAAGRRAVINSSWGRAPFESLYRYGIDYRRIFAAGVDGMVVETAAAGLAMDGYCDHPSRHYDFLTMLQLNRAAVPDSRLIFLHNVHDVVEQWDALRHTPALLEKEIYSLANVFQRRGDGALQPAADGFLACLGDGLSPAEWAWLRELWEWCYDATPTDAPGFTLVWSDAAFDAQLDDFLTHRTWITARLFFELTWRGALVQTTVRVEDLAVSAGPLLVLNPQLLPPAELAAVLARGGPVVLLGRRPPGLPPATVEFRDTTAIDPLWCGVYGAHPNVTPLCDDAPADDLPADLQDVVDPRGYWDHLPYRPVSEGFLAACVEVLHQVGGGPRVVEGADQVTLMVDQLAPDRWRVAVKSNVPTYAKPLIDLGRPIRELRVVTQFPKVAVRPEGSSFRVKVPGRGITVVEATLGEA